VTRTFLKSSTRIGPCLLERIGGGGVVLVNHCLDRLIENACGTVVGYDEHGGLVGEVVADADGETVVAGEEIWRFLLQFRVAHPNFGVVYEGLLNQIATAPEIVDNSPVVVLLGEVVVVLVGEVYLQWGEAVDGSVE
jgi:hypothetical protein